MLGQPKGHLEVILMGVQSLLSVYPGEKSSRPSQRGLTLHGNTALALLAKASGIRLAPTVFSVLQSRGWVQGVLFVGVDEPLNLEIQIMECMDQLVWAVESGKGLQGLG